MLTDLLRARRLVDADRPQAPVGLFAFELDGYAMMGDVGFILHDDPAYLDRATPAIDRRLR